jgi:hypothetical protein
MSLNLKKLVRRVVHKITPGFLLQTIVLDDRDNLASTLRDKYTKDHAIAFNRDESYVFDSLREKFPVGRILVRSYGYKHFLQSLGWPQGRPLTDLGFSTHAGKNGSDIVMALDYTSHIGFLTERIVIVTADIDFRGVALHAENLGITSVLMNFGGHNSNLSDAFTEVMPIPIPELDQNLVKEKLKAILLKLLDKSLTCSRATVAGIARDKYSANRDNYLGCGSFTNLCFDVLPELEIFTGDKTKFYLPRTIGFITPQLISNSNRQKKIKEYSSD